MLGGRRRVWEAAYLVTLGVHDLIVLKQPLPEVKVVRFHLQHMLPQFSIAQDQSNSVHYVMFQLKSRYMQAAACMVSLHLHQMPPDLRDADPNIKSTQLNVVSFTFNYLIHNQPLPKVKVVRFHLQHMLPQLSIAQDQSHSVTMVWFI